MEGAGPDQGEYQSFFTKYVIEAITVEMESRGYTKSDDPDLLVNFNARLQDKTKVTTSSAPPPMYGGYYGYRGGYYGAWGGYGYGTETHVSQYTEGTFNIDIVDNKTRRLVWEAVGVGRVTEKKLDEPGKGRANSCYQSTFRSTHTTAGAARTERLKTVQLFAVVVGEFEQAFRVPSRSVE